MNTHNVADRMALAARIADRYSVAEIECECSVENHGGVKWYDTRSMIDPREHCSENIDMAQEVIGYALHRRLVVRHPTLPHLVRVVAQPAPPTSPTD